MDDVERIAVPASGTSGNGPGLRLSGIADCRIGSCQRQGMCMYTPCRRVAQHLKQENAKS